MNLRLTLQGDEERWRSEGDGTESSSRQLVSVSNLTQVDLTLMLSAHHLHLDIFVVQIKFSEGCRVIFY